MPAIVARLTFSSINPYYFLKDALLGATKVDLDKIWENSSYKPPGASCTAPGPQKQPGIIKNLLVFSSTKYKNPDFGAWISVSGSGG